MQTSSTERVKRFRENNAGLRFDTFLSPQAHDAIDTIVEAHNCTRRAAVEHALTVTATNLQGPPECRSAT